MPREGRRHKTEGLFTEKKRAAQRAKKETDESWSGKVRPVKILSCGQAKVNAESESPRPLGEHRFEKALTDRRSCELPSHLGLVESVVRAPMVHRKQL